MSVKICIASTSDNINNVPSIQKNHRLETLKTSQSSVILSIPFRRTLTQVYWQQGRRYNPTTNLSINNYNIPKICIYNRGNRRFKYFLHFIGKIIMLRKIKEIELLLKRGKLAILKSRMALCPLNYIWNLIFSSRFNMKSQLSQPLQTSSSQLFFRRKFPFIQV